MFNEPQIVQVRQDERRRRLAAPVSCQRQPRHLEQARHQRKYLVSLPQPDRRCVPPLDCAQHDRRFAVVHRRSLRRISAASPHLVPRRWATMEWRMLIDDPARAVSSVAAIAAAASATSASTIRAKPSGLWRAIAVWKRKTIVLALGQITIVAAAPRRRAPAASLTTAAGCSRADQYTQVAGHAISSSLGAATNRANQLAERRQSRRALR